MLACRDLVAVLLRRSRYDSTLSVDNSLLWVRCFQKFRSLSLESRKGLLRVPNPLQRSESAVTL